MRVCIPVEEDQGLESAVCAHFGSAPAFMIVDTDSGLCRAVPNASRHHGHGMCMPLASLQGESIDAMVVGGVGMGALNKLSAAGIPVYISERATVAETVAELKSGALRPIQPDQACTRHGHGHPVGPRRGA